MLHHVRVAMELLRNTRTKTAKKRLKTKESEFGSFALVATQKGALSAQATP